MAWFDYRSAEIYVLTSDDMEKRDAAGPFVSTNAMEPVLHSGNYALYRYTDGNASAIYETWHLDKGSGWRRFSQKFL